MTEIVESYKFKDDKGMDWVAYPGDTLFAEVKKRYAERKDATQDVVIPSSIMFSDEKSGWQELAKKVKEDLGNYSFFLKPKTFGQNLEFPEDTTKLTSEQLGQWMGRLESYRSFVQTQLAFLDVDRTMAQGVFDISLGKAMGTLEGRSEKKKLKEVLQASAITSIPKLKEIKTKLIELDAKYQALDRLNQIYTGQIFTLSREMSRRQGSGDKYT